MDGRWRTDMLELAYRAVADPTNPDAVGEVLGRGLVIDAVLFEGGAFADFLAVRGVLLPGR